MTLTPSQLAMLLHGLNLAEAERRELMAMIAVSGSDENGNLLSTVSRQVQEIKDIRPIMYRFFSEIERAIDAAEKANDN